MSPNFTAAKPKAKLVGCLARLIRRHRLDYSQLERRRKMQFRNVLLVAMLTASLYADKKKPAEHDWQTGKLVKILHVASRGDFSDPEFCISGTLSGLRSGNYDNWVMLIITGPSSVVVTSLAPNQKPKIHLGGPVKYAIETVRCVLCPHDRTAPDEFGRTKEKLTGTKIDLYLLDEDNRVSRFTDAHEHALPLPPCRARRSPGAFGPGGDDLDSKDGPPAQDGGNDPLRGLGPDKKQK